MIKGYSTGALAKSDFQRAIRLLQDSSANAIELSALREDEAEVLINAIPKMDLTRFRFISFHAPSKLDRLNEEELIRMLEPVVHKGWPVIIHPDIITDYTNWTQLGSNLCIENMDKRKKAGRTVIDLDEIFYKLPEASFCLDIAHARQVDPTMTEAFYMVTKFKNRLKEIHISSLNTQSKHEPLTIESLLSFRKLTGFIPEGIPVILESPVTPDRMEREMDLAVSILFQENDTKKSNQELKPVFNYINTLSY